MQFTSMSNMVPYTTMTVVEVQWTKEFDQSFICLRQNAADLDFGSIYLYIMNLICSSNIITQLELNKSSPEYQSLQTIRSYLNSGVVNPNQLIKEIWYPPCRKNLGGLHCAMQHWTLAQSPAKWSSSLY